MALAMTPSVATLPPRNNPRVRTPSNSHFDRLATEDRLEPGRRTAVFLGLCTAWSPAFRRSSGKMRIAVIIAAILDILSDYLRSMVS